MLMTDRSDDLPSSISPTLRHAIGELRRGVPMREEWRDETTRLVRDAARAPRRLSLHPAIAAAAALCFMIGGAVATTVVFRAQGDGTAQGTEHRTPVRFLYVAPQAQRVALVGDFNGWSAKSMTRLDDTGTWMIELPLPPGRFSYAFVVDDTLVADPRAPSSTDDDYGVANSVVLVRGGAS
jgi:hypothetical protein